MGRNKKYIFWVAPHFYGLQLSMFFESPLTFMGRNKKVCFSESPLTFMGRSRIGFSPLKVTPHCIFNTMSGTMIL